MPKARTKAKTKTRANTKPRVRADAKLLVKPRVDHDQLMKMLITALLRPFVEVFFPQVYPYIDWSDVKPAPTEMFGLGWRAETA